MEKSLQNTINTNTTFTPNSISTRLRAAIPVSFNIFSNKVNVTFVPEIRSNEDSLALGSSDPYSNSILLNSMALANEDLMVDTFYHEKVHYILDSMGRGDLSSDESFVETFSRLLRQTDDSSIYL